MWQVENPWLIERNRTIHSLISFIFNLRLFKMVAYNLTICLIILYSCCSWNRPEEIIIITWNKCPDWFIPFRTQGCTKKGISIPKGVEVQFICFKTVLIELLTVFAHCVYAWPLLYPCRSWVSYSVYYPVSSGCSPSQLEEWAQQAGACVPCQEWARGYPCRGLPSLWAVCFGTCQGKRWRLWQLLLLLPATK